MCQPLPVQPLVSLLLNNLYLNLSEDNKTQKKRKRDENITAVADVMYTTPVISLSAQQLLAVAQFLSSCESCPCVCVWREGIVLVYFSLSFAWACVALKCVCVCTL